VCGTELVPTHDVRQPFSRSEIGLYKSVVLANRLNLFWGLNWEGIPEQLDTKRRLDGVDIVIGCVDTRKARAAIAKCAEDWNEVDYWLDLGNNADSGLFTPAQRILKPANPPKFVLTLLLTGEANPPISILMYFAFCSPLAHSRCSRGCFAAERSLTTEDS
jgi:hypothetical protein